jgi:hypothetical protein
MEKALHRVAQGTTSLYKIIVAALLIYELLRYRKKLINQERRREPHKVI